MKLGWRIATRFLKSNKGQTILIIFGIAIGVSVQIFIGSLIQGLQKGLVEKTIGNSSQITISSNVDEKKITDYETMVDTIVQADSNIKQVSVSADYPAFMEYNGNSQSVLVRGFQIDQADKIYNIIDRIEEGTYPQKENEIILGIDLKDQYGFKVGDEISITTTDQKQADCKIVGFYDLKVSSLNKSWGIMTLESVQNIFDAPNSITSIEMQVKEASVFQADEIAANITTALGNDNLKVENWKVLNEQLLSGLQGQSISSIMIQVFVMISVIIGITSVLAVT
ncbi:MAG: ABC transporter permease, partial [Mobilitalea sp.]